MERSLAEVDPAIVLNAAAYNQVDVAEKEPVAAYNANALAVRNLAMAALKKYVEQPLELLLTLR